MQLKAEYRHQPFCPSRAPYVRCPRIIEHNGQWQGWLSLQHCLTCSYRRSLEIRGQGGDADVMVDCAATNITQDDADTWIEQHLPSPREGIK